MTREEFVEWFDSNTLFEKDCMIGDFSWRYEANYEPLMFEYVSINEENVLYSWEELYWGGSSWKEREFSFDEFVEAHKNDAIKY
jgi:hypothetical protein